MRESVNKVSLLWDHLLLLVPFAKILRFPQTTNKQPIRASDRVAAVTSVRAAEAFIMAEKRLPTMIKVTIHGHTQRHQYINLTVEESVLEQRDLLAD